MMTAAMKRRSQLGKPRKLLLQKKSLLRKVVKRRKNQSPRKKELRMTMTPWMWTVTTSQ